MIKCHQNTTHKVSTYKRKCFALKLIKKHAQKDFHLEQQKVRNIIFHITENEYDEQHIQENDSDLEENYDKHTTTDVVKDNTYNDDQEDYDDDMEPLDVDRNASQTTTVSTESKQYNLLDDKDLNEEQKIIKSRADEIQRMQDSGCKYIFYWMILDQIIIVIPTLWDKRKDNKLVKHAMFKGQVILELYKMAADPTFPDIGEHHNFFNYGRIVMARKHCHGANIAKLEKEPTKEDPRKFVEQHALFSVRCNASCSHQVMEKN